MKRSDVNNATPLQIETWLQDAGWVRYEFMGWRLHVKRRVVHCNLTGAIDMQLRRDAANRGRTRITDEEIPGDDA